MPTNSQFCELLIWKLEEMQADNPAEFEQAVSNLVPENGATGTVADTMGAVRSYLAAAPRTRLTWLEMALLSAGDRVAVVEKQNDFVPAGTQCVIVETGLNEIWGGLMIHPESPEWLAEEVANDHVENVYLRNTPPPEGGPEWFKPSPFCLI